MLTSTLNLTSYLYNDSPLTNTVISLFYQLKFNFQVSFWYEKSGFMLKSPYFYNAK